MRRSADPRPAKTTRWHIWRSFTTAFLDICWRHPFPSGFAQLRPQPPQPKFLTHRRVLRAFDPTHASSSIRPPRSEGNSRDVWVWVHAAQRPSAPPLIERGLGAPEAPVFEKPDNRFEYELNREGGRTFAPAILISAAKGRSSCAPSNVSARQPNSAARSRRCWRQLLGAIDSGTAAFMGRRRQKTKTSGTELSEVTQRAACRLPRHFCR